VQGPGADAGTEEIAKALRRPLLKVFPPALLGRLIVIPYYPLSDEMMGAIIRLQLGRIETRAAELRRSPHLHRRSRGLADRRPLHRDRERRPHDRCHPDPVNQNDGRADA
jgi:ATP-dependent Clp protease ATP-binding subunit ClpA